ncbi:MAG: AAA family ATPase [Paracoccaceae bacterium]|nr:AAA family ATPase [Paracoccaceae bacterium]
MAEGFRIGRITIEGFKGFTNRKELILENRHVFLLGSNGNGKSSIIEAIRWGLFGSTHRRNDIVANREYAKKCRVEIELLRGGKEWHLRRTLIRGVTAGSDARLFDAAGNERNLREIMPQLDSLDAGEGTHIIFAPQAAPLKRRPEDLSPFERTVFNHLGLTHARTLLSHVDTFLLELTDDEMALDQRISELRKRVEGRVEALKEERGRVLRSPPWGEDNAPTVAESEVQIKSLIDKINGPIRQQLDGLSIGALVDNAEELLETRSSEERDALQDKLLTAENRRTQVERVRNTLGQFKEKKDELATARSKMANLLGSSSLEDIRGSIDTMRNNIDTLTLQSRLATVATELLRRGEEGSPVSCPICEEVHDRNKLQLALGAISAVGSEDAMLELQNTEQILHEAECLAADIGEREQEIEETERELSGRLVDIEGMADQSVDAIDEANLDEEIETLINEVVSIEAQLSNRKAWKNELEKGLSGLRVEARFHEIQDELRRFRPIEGDFERVKRAYEYLVAFGESVRDIRESVNSALTEELRVKTPVVAQEFTHVFAALTRHPYFNRLVFDEAELPRLELGVSNADPSAGIHPTGVLNGQAQSALELVPYFALSQTDEAPTEVYLVLLDDPTRAFDKEHIGILIQLLAELGKRVQIVVASQESETFRELLPGSFNRQDYVVIEPMNWSFDGGPELEFEYE